MAPGVKVTREGPGYSLPGGLAGSTGVPDGDGIDWEDGGGAPGSVPGGVGNFELANEGGDPNLFAHGTTGTTETIDPTDGNVHTLTLDDDCTVTLSAPSGDAASLLLWITQDGTGGRDITWAGSVSEIGTPDTTLGTTNLAVATTKDGGATWVVAWIGGGGSSVAALDDLTDVTITAPAEDDTLRFVGSVWINDNRRWEAVTDGEDVFVWDGDDLVHEWETY